MEIIKNLSGFVMPICFLGIICYGLYKKIDIFDTFLIGAAEGLKIIVKILPALCGLLAAVSMLRASGAIDFIVSICSPFLKYIKIPAEILPLALLRPISGSGSLAILSDILKNYGADSQAGKIASVIMGSSETTFYAIAVYFGSVGIKNSGHTLKAALFADLVCVLCGAWVTTLLLC